MKTGLNRRQALGAAFAAGGVGLLSTPLAALTIVPADAQSEALVRAQCAKMTDHDALAAELIAAVEGDPSRSAAEIREIVAALTCPLCGCRLSLAAADAPPRF